MPVTGTFNGATIFNKGTLYVQMFNPSTNNLDYYSSVVSTDQLQTNINLGTINAGPGNAPQINIPDTPSLTLNLTTADFSLEGRALSVGGNVTYNGVVPVDEVAEATGATLTVSQTPVAPLGGCDIVGYVGNDGTAYTIDPATREVQNFTATAGEKYCVHYYTVNPNAKQLNINTMFAPAVERAFITMPLYATQQFAGSELKGSHIGNLYITVPRLQLNGDVSTDGSQTTPGTTVMNGTALSYDEACEAGIQCGSSASPKLAYMVMELFGSPDQFATGLAIVGGDEIEVAVGATATIPVKYVMDDGSLGNPLMTDLTFVSGTPAVATVSDQGVVTGVAAGTSDVTITSKGAKKLTTTAKVTVTGGTPAPDPTADVTFTMTTPTPDASNTITGGGTDKAVAVNVASGTSSVVLEATLAAGQSVTVGGTDASDVTAGGTATAPTYTVNTTGGSKSFTLTVAETGKSEITYTVTVTVA